MALTSQQKHYIKKNFKNFSVDKMADDLNLGKKEITKYLKKHLPEKQYEKLFDIEKSHHEDPLSDISRFIIDNINYFILLSILVVICYFNSLGNTFVSDDIMGLVHNPIFLDFKNAFSGYNSFSFFPYFILFKIDPTNPALFRMINIIFHLGSAYLIFILLAIMTKKKTVGLISAMIFAVHPILIESVTWISGRPYSQYAFFFLLSFLLYLISKKRNSNKLYYYSLAAYAFSVMTSEKATSLFLVFALYEFCFGNWKKEWKKILPYFIFSLIIAFIVVSGFGHRVQELKTSYYQEKIDTINPLVQVPIAISSYLGLFLWPDNLTIYHTELDFSPLVFFACIITVLLFMSAVIYSWKKNKHIFFWLSFFIIALLPTMTPFGVSWIVAERYAYLAILGLAVAAAVLIDWLAENHEKAKSAIFSILAIIILALSIRTIIRNNDWKDEDHLWPATAKAAPSGAPIHNNLGDVYARKGDHEKAIAEFKKAIEINPRYGDAYHNLANIYQATGRSNEAEENYKKALNINPNIWQSHQNLSAIFFERGDKEKALEHIQKALEINPSSEQLKNNLELMKNYK